MITTKGHLTQTEKKHIKHLLNLGLTEGKINRKTYHIAKAEGQTNYRVSITEMQTAWCELTPKLTTNKYEFIL